MAHYRIEQSGPGGSQWFTLSGADSRTEAYYDLGFYVRHASGSERFRIVNEATHKAGRPYSFEDRYDLPRLPGDPPRRLDAPSGGQGRTRSRAARRRGLR